jgi:anti-sigma factor RsiW
MGLHRIVFGLSCREIADFLMAYLDGELPAKERRAFGRHLFWCRACVAYVDSYRAAVRLARAAGDAGADEPPEPIPEALVQAILEARSAGRTRGA